MDAPEDDRDIKLQKVSSDFIADFDRSLPAFLRKPDGQLRSRVRNRETARLTTNVSPVSMSHDCTRTKAEYEYHQSFWTLSKSSPSYLILICLDGYPSWPRRISSTCTRKASAVPDPLKSPRRARSCLSPYRLPYVNFSTPLLRSADRPSFCVSSPSKHAISNLCSPPSNQLNGEPPDPPSSPSPIQPALKPRPSNPLNGNGYGRRDTSCFCGSPTSCSRPLTWRPSRRPKTTRTKLTFHS